MIDKNRFARAKSAINDPHVRYNIGTYKERSQHRLLKLYYEPDIEFHEVPYDGFIADILNNAGITEIQTAGFRSLNEKLAVFLSENNVRIVYPTALKKRVCWIDPENGESAFGRYTTYNKSHFHLLSELLSIVDYFGVPQLCVDVVYMSVSDCRLLDGYGKDRKKKATKIDTVPEELTDIVTLHNSADIRKLIGLEEGREMTREELSEYFGLSRISLWRAIKFLLITEILTISGKKGNTIIYKVTSEKDYL